MVARSQLSLGGRTLAWKEHEGISGTMDVLYSLFSVEGAQKYMLVKTYHAKHGRALSFIVWELYNNKIHYRIE